MPPPKGQGVVAPSFCCSDLKLLKIRSKEQPSGLKTSPSGKLGIFGSLGTR